MKTHPTIYWAEIWLNKDVHMIGLGFTKLFYKFVCADSATEAEAAVHQWAAAEGCDVLKVRVSRAAVKQDITTYTFPEQILNLPDEVLQAEYERREYPASWRTKGQRVDVEVAHA